MSTELETFFKNQGLRPMGTLAHWGVRGMKWGVRRSDAALAKAAAARGDSPDAIRAQETLRSIRSKKSLSGVSDSDLQHLVNRLNLEKRYSEVDPSSFEKGHKAVKTLLAVGETMNKAVEFGNSPTGKLLLSKFFRGTGKHAPGKHTAEVLSKTVK